PTQPSSTLFPYTTLFRSDVLVENGKIAAVGRDLEAGGAEVVDASGTIVIPGFVDTHRHTWQTPVRGVLACCTLDHYFAVMLGSVDRKSTRLNSSHVKISY